MKDNLLDQIEWVEAPMELALKVWAKNEEHVKCVVGEVTHYHIESHVFRLRADEVAHGTWYIERV
ncbi:hypothetical protein [Phage f2b1]|nr:hypothetical protein [Phage f2b1]